MRQFWLLYILGFIRMLSFAQNQDLNLTSDKNLPPHPRILLFENETKEIVKTINTSPVWGKMHQTILKESDAIISLPVLERVMIGKRLLDKSRECLRRVLYLSYSYRLTGEEKYFKRAESEMLAVSAFCDWNPPHFLDVAEMTMGLAIGYDWLYDKLSSESKKIISDAIFRKGLEASYNERHNWFLRVTHNWNQVCNGGMIYGALAIADEHPSISKQVIERALNTIKLPMEDYKPNGAYPEGYGYWSYGTSFNVLLLSAIEKAYGTDFGLTKIPGFLKTGEFRQHMTGVTGNAFNWGDNGEDGNFSPIMFWLAKKNNNPSLLFTEKRYLNREDYSAFARDRMLPMCIIWGKDIAINEIPEPKAKVWIGQGASPVALMRTSWTDPNGIYLGFKAGADSVNHAHMDVGSFVMEAQGVRWASDLGAQDYNSLESKGIQVFGRTQDAQRWKIFRMNNFVHNTLTIDGQLQLVKGYAKIDRYSDRPDFSYAISDLSTVYEGQLASVSRGAGIVDGSYVVIQDELKALDKPSNARWTMLTKADVSIKGNTAVLKRSGKQLTLKVESPAKVTMKTWSAQPTTDYDAPNAGFILVGFEIELPANKSETITVKMIPQGAERKAKTKIKSLSDW
jgi:hypothetical protein